MNGILADGVADAEECRDLLDTLNSFSARDIERGEATKATTLLLCDPAPALLFGGRRYCFTGTFTFGDRRAYEATVVTRGGARGSLTRRTDVLVIGMYATESWKHSSFGTKIVKAVDWREAGAPIAIVSEEHWARHL